VARKQCGPGRSCRSNAEPSLNFAVAADRSGSASTPVRLAAQAALLEELRFQRDLDLGASLLIRTEIALTAAGYATLDPALVRALGADRFLATSLHAVPR